MKWLFWLKRWAVGVISTQDAYLQDFVWVPSDRFLAVESDDRFAWVPAPSDREVER